MRILKIKGKNITSLQGEFEIDFEKSPLKNAGLFAITGKTGSGKSSILDCLSVALYGTCPRFKKAAVSRDGDGKGQGVGSDNINSNKAENLMRRSCSEAFAEVKFEVAGKKYRSKWFCRRSRTKKDGSLGTLQAPSMQLWQIYEDGTEEVILEKKSDVVDKIEEITSLKFEQFSRTVLLAQGDFAAFLKAEDKDRADILEKLTSSEIYSFISQRIHEKSSAARKEKEEIEARINAINSLSQEEIDALNKEERELKDSSLVQKEKIEKKESSISKLKNYAKDKEAFSKSEEDLKKALEEKKKFEESDKEGVLLRKLEEVEPLREDCNTAKHLIKRKSDYSNSKNTYEEDIKKLETALTDKKKDLEKALEYKNEKAEFYEKQKPKIEDLKKLNANLQNKEGNINRYKNTLQAENTKLKAVLEAIKNEQKAIIANKKTLENVEDYTKKNERDSILLSDSSLENSFDRLKNALAYLQKIDLLSLEKKLDLAKKDREKLEEKQKNLQKVDIDLNSLRLELRNKEACPLCGSKIDKILLESVIDLADKLSKEELSSNYAQNLEKELECKKKEVEQLETDLSQLLAQQKIYKDEIQNAKAKILEYSYLFENEQISKIEREDLEAICLLQEDIKKRKKLFVDAQNLCRDLQEKNLKLEEKISKEKIEIESLKKEIENLERSIEEETLGVAELKMQIEKVIADENKEDFSNLETYEKKILEEKNKSEELYNKLDKTISEQNAALEEKKGILEKTEKDLQDANVELKAVLAKIDAFSAALSFDTSLPGNKVSELLGLDRQEVEKLRRKEKELTQNEAGSKARFASAKEALEIAEKEYIALKQRQEILENEPLRESLARLESEKIEASTQKEDVDRRLGEIKNKKETDKSSREEKERFLGLLKAKEKENESLFALNEFLGSSSGDKFKSIAQGYTLDILLEHTNAYLKSFNNRYKIKRQGSSLGLKIVDMDMMNEERAVSTLSGGESFLVSLSLALALSNISNSSNMSVETLFIDEGFGSLDNETLDMAMSALEHLQESGKKVGIVSHVGDVNERIACKICVEAMGGGSSRVSIVG